MKTHGKPEVPRKRKNPVRKKVSARVPINEKRIKPTPQGSLKKRVIVSYVVSTGVASAIGLGSIWEPWMVHIAWPFAFATLGVLGTLATSDVG